ncbi:MAG: sialate O-acetylesterase [Armatimonadota bacterium]
MQTALRFVQTLFAMMLLAVSARSAPSQADTKTLRVFIFAGQSNMVGSHSRATDIKLFPPFAGLDQPQENVMYSYSIGREEMNSSNGWTTLKPLGNVIGPEVSFARKVARVTKAPIAIIKCASGGTTLGEDWNPDTPGGFKLYPLTLQLIRSSLAELDRKGIRYRVEGFMWHQGENDMFSRELKPAYAKNLKNFLASWRRDLNIPKLNFYIGELCTKTIWGMDNRENMHAIRTAQKAVAAEDPRAEYIPTSQNAVEIGDGAGLHYHYGTLGQLQHGEGYANAYLHKIGKLAQRTRPLKTWPFRKSSPVKLFILAGHRNMEGERAFRADLLTSPIAKDNPKIPFRYNLGGGTTISRAWEPLGVAGASETFGPELSFGQQLQAASIGSFAIVKFTHSGSQINDWTPAGTSATDLNLYSKFIDFIKQSIKDLNAKGHQVELAGIFYHLGENDMAYGPYRRQASKWLAATVNQSRIDLSMPSLKWFVSQQTPSESSGPGEENLADQLAKIAASDSSFIVVPTTDLPPQRERIVLTAPGVVKLGELLASRFLADQR